MQRHRYLIVEHSYAPSEKFEETMLPVHTLLGTYHWAKLDDQHVFVTAKYALSHHTRIQGHAKVSVLPSMSSGKTLVSHLKDRHWQALSAKLGLDHTATMTDAVELAEQVFGPVFSPDR